jgi:signal transduction histidine kinase
MVGVLVSIICIMLAVIYFQYSRRKKDEKDLTYVYEKINSILNKKTGEKVLVNTDNESLKTLLTEINELLDYNQKVVADFTKTEISMRKMLSNISHDLKTPLTVVLGYIETMKLDDSMSNEERNILLKKVEVKAKEVLELINKFFHLAKLESGDKEIPLTRINLNELSRKNILQFYDVLNAKDFEVVIDIPNEDIYCLGNEEALTRALNNLISNGINHGGDGKVIGLRLSQDDKYVYLEIWDKGKGISEQHLSRVFERMYTLEDSRNKLYQGSGLGLTITKRLIEIMGGEIKLCSKPFERTSFTIKLKKIIY